MKINLVTKSYIGKIIRVKLVSHIKLVWFGFGQVRQEKVKFGSGFIKRIKLKFTKKGWKCKIDSDSLNEHYRD